MGINYDQEQSMYDSVFNFIILHYFNIRPVAIPSIFIIRVPFRKSLIHRRQTGWGRMRLSGFVVRFNSSQKSILW